ncbi:hypothetical protein MY3296_006666 [Beauveria thailandica]
MNSPTTDRKSGFERLFASSEGQNELYRQLESAKAAQEEATPEPSSPNDHASTEEDFKWQCEILYKELAGEDIESIRLAVIPPDYWATECRQFEFTPPMTDSAWKGDQSNEQELKPPFLCFRIRENMFDPKGWILGSHGDSDLSDLQIANTKSTGISRQACRIDISPRTHEPRVTQLSDRQLCIHGPSLIRCKPGTPQVLADHSIIDFGAVKFRVWTPIRTATETSQYKAKAREYSKDIMQSIPKRLPSLQARTKTSADLVRYGMNGAVYVVHGHGMQGKGAHASVIKVKNVGTGKIFGAKEPYFKISDNADTARQRFEALRMEYNHIKHLDHPYILKAFDLVLAEDLTLPPWMIVEYIPLNLQEALPAFDEHDRFAAILHLGSALTYLHASGITHRDLKPSNALATRQDGKLIVKLADFGTSKQNNSEIMDTFTGTEIYMAPELFAKPRRYTTKVDMWALGLIGMQIFTSWDSDRDQKWDATDFATWVCTVALKSISEAPDSLRPMLKGLLRKDAERRWSSRKCLHWLWKHEPSISTSSSEHGTGRASQQKRPASMELRRFSGDHSTRQYRGPDLSLSTGRMRASDNRNEVSLPDTESPRPEVQDLPSAASTPRIDEALSDVSNDEESSGADTDLEEWHMELKRGSGSA